MKIQVIIELDNITGNISLSGPLQDKIFCLGLFEMAKKIVIEHKEDTLVKPVQGFMVPPKTPPGAVGKSN